MDFIKYTTKITLYNSYFDFNDRFSLKSILAIFQDVASTHAENIGLGYEDMCKKKYYWVLSRIKFDILKMPQINQEVIVETWPHQKGKIDFDRDMRILNKDGEILVIATSKWCVIDTVSRMLKRTEDIYYSGTIFPKVNYEERFNKIIIPNIEAELKSEYIVNFSDLDHNKHMNNTNYANLVINAIENKFVNHFEINYLKECKFGDKIKIFSMKDENGEYVVGYVEGECHFAAIAK